MQIDSALWIAHPVLQLAAATAVFSRRLHRTFPVFFAYLIWQILVFCALFPIHRWGTYAEYFYCFWIADAISLALGFKIIHEIFLDVFRPYHTLKDLGSVLFKWAALVMILVACVVAAASPATDQGPLVQAVFTVQRCVRVMQCGLILFLLVFSGYLGVSWRQHSFGIALGFGGFAIVELALIALNAAGRETPAGVNLINAVAYNCAILVWFGYALLNSKSRNASANLLMSQRWDQSLTDLQHPLPADSLIPMFEGMVDRAFSRTNGGQAHSESDAETEIAAAVAAGAESAGSPSPASKSPTPSPRRPGS
ncbi:MAG: hypothetical protein LAN83_16340 [Acidobacteriia bacterium]|nr:hypothetical protein [Terriglobia bacterium]